MFCLWFVSFFRHVTFLLFFVEYSNPGSRLFITPESILLNRKGMVTFSAGIPDSKYMAPESLSKNTLDSSELQKVHT